MGLPDVSKVDAGGDKSLPQSPVCQLVLLIGIEVDEF
jgi:hypothetical protein